MDHKTKHARPIRPHGPCGSILCALAAFLILSGVERASAQVVNEPDTPTPQESAVKPIRPWQLVIGIGRRNDNGRWDDLVEGFEAGGFDDGQCEGWFGPCPYPKGGAKNQVVHLALVRDFGRKFGIRLFYNNGDYLEGTGSNDYSTTQVNYVGVESELRTVGLLAEFVPARAIRFGAGPSWNTLKTAASTLDFEGRVVESFSTTSEVMGLVLGLASNLPPDHPVFVHLAIRGHFIAEQTIGPYESMPATKITMSHTTLVVALGLCI